MKERNIEDVEAFVPDMAGSARGKVVPADKFGAAAMKMPEAVFAQTVSGSYIDDPNNVEDRDMILRPDPVTLRPVPWARRTKRSRSRVRSAWSSGSPGMKCSGEA